MKSINKESGGGRNGRLMKSELRNPKAETNPKPDGGKVRSAEQPVAAAACLSNRDRATGRLTPHRSRVSVSDFGLPWASGLRISGLATVFRALLAALVCSVLPATAGVPEPDNILYGTIIVDGVLITSNRTEVVVEARRTAQGPAIASYRMGDRPGVGNHYSLRLAMESAAPRVRSDAVLVNDTVFITVKDGTGDLAQAQFPVTQRGETLRLDFAFGDLDADGDGLPDAWENARFGNTLATATGNNDGDPLNNLQEFIAGTNPLDPASVLAVSVSRSGGQTAVSFQTIAASGAGYEGRTRLYTLERSSLLNNDWQAISGWSDFTGTGQTVTYQPGDGEPGPVFYRARVRLAP